jgi:glycosyltransferase involved in cell wall biosynthesis
MQEGRLVNDVDKKDTILATTAAMKIAQIVGLHESVPPKSQNGLEFVVSWITEELVRRGHEVTLFAPGDSKTSAKLVSILPIATNNDMTRGGQPFFDIWNLINAATREKEFDIIHNHSSSTAFIMPFVKSQVIQTLHHPYADDFLSKYVQKKKLAKSLKPVLESYGKIHYVAISKSQHKDFKKAERFYFKHKSVIHNGIPVERFAFNAKPKDYLLFIGYMNKNKGADVAVRIAKKLGMKLILAGNNFGEEEFFNKSIKPYLSSKIRYVGVVGFKEKVELYRNAVAKIAPLQWAEPFGLTLIESQACGTPVVAFNNGAAAELIQDGKTGFIVKDEKEMAAAIKKIHSIKRKDCRDWVEKRFSVKAMVDKYEKLYQSLIKK